MSRIHVFSACFGLALAGLCFLTMAPTAPSAAPLRMEFVPHPRDMVQIKEGTPYVVPVERIFVVTGLGAGLGQGATLLVNGTAELQTYATSGISILPAPLGLKFPAGSIVTVTTSNGSPVGRVLGFTALL